MNRQADFQQMVWAHYGRLGRHDLPWRHDITPYRVVVSEVMLQQTQAARVEPKFVSFTTEFGGFVELAQSPIKEVLGAWQGLGYNRRALYLHSLAQTVQREYHGELPNNPELLRKLPGIGPNTAGSIMAFAFDQPVVFIETNIRRAYLHHFFPTAESVGDAELRPLIEQTLDLRRPRAWYWALMDYGSWLATQTTNPNRRSRHYTRQSRFEGSIRQLRGEVLRRLLAGPQPLSGLPSDERLPRILEDLIKEKFITHVSGVYQIS